MSHIHILPVNDLIEHDSDSFDECICGPEVEFVDGGAVISHHSLDGRELDEQEAQDG